MVSSSRASAASCEQLCFLLREQGATHVGCATDRVIRSFRNDLYPGYKTDAGMDPELLAQFPVAEAAIEALGLVLWPMVEFEADDAIAAAAERFAADPRVEQVVICTPDKDMAQCVRGERIVLWDRRRTWSTTRPASARSGACPRRASPTAWPSWATPPTASRASQAGATSPRRPCSHATGRLEAIPANAGDWDVPGLRGAPALAATLRERMDEALLYRDLARLRTTADGVPIPEVDVDELRWRGADRARWTAFCESGGSGACGPAAPLGGRGRVGLGSSGEPAGEDPAG